MNQPSTWLTVTESMRVPGPLASHHPSKRQARWGPWFPHLDIVIASAWNTFFPFGLCHKPSAIFWDPQSVSLSIKKELFPDSICFSWGLQPHPHPRAPPSHSNWTSLQPCYPTRVFSCPGNERKEAPQQLSATSPGHAERAK